MLQQRRLKKKSSNRVSCFANLLFKSFAVCTLAKTTPPNAAKRRERPVAIHAMARRNNCGYKLLPSYYAQKYRKKAGSSPRRQALGLSPAPRHNKSRRAHKCQATVPIDRANANCMRCVDDMLQGSCISKIPGRR